MEIRRQFVVNVIVTFIATFIVSVCVGDYTLSGLFSMFTGGFFGAYVYDYIKAHLTS